ncbi:hypothetical protein BJV78DRAFT_1357942 [Lactifluus subvellereus]|nr:hypothetical protein BJV78DRAFT_1357942 [Lactifluus subvellereus]
MFRPATTAFRRCAIRARSEIRTFGNTIVARDPTSPTGAQKHATSSEPPPYLNIKLPDLSAPPPEPELHIPFTPDFWESSRAKAAAAPAPLEEPHVPKVIVIAGDTARADSMHISEPGREHVSVLDHHAEPSSAPKVSNLRSLFLDIADDVPLPKDLSVLKVNRAQRVLLGDLIEEISTSTGQGQSRFHSRTLDKDEVRGVWILLGLLAGSWLAGGLLRKKSKYPESE